MKYPPENMEFKKLENDYLKPFCTIYKADTPSNS